MEDRVRGLRTGQGDEVQIGHGVAHLVHVSRGVHGSPYDFSEKIGAYLGGLTSNLEGCISIIFVSGANL